MSSVARKSILLVEDEAILAMVEKMQLEKNDYSVNTVSSGEDAIDYVRKNNVDLILMDINLGSGIDGTQAAEIILKEYDIPILFLSSHSDRETVEKTEKITSYGYVVKGCNVTILDASIKMAFKLFESKMKEKAKELQLELDIQRRKELEVVLLYQASLLEQVNNAIITIDFNNKILSWNKHAEVLYQWTKEETIGRILLSC